MTESTCKSRSPGSKLQPPGASLDWAERIFDPRRYKPGGIGNWSGHLPFAHDLVASLKPDLVVELGTHYGESYFGLCEAVREHGLCTRCYAVDTWRGDEQSGHYDDAVYEDVDAYNRAHYSSFSVLLRQTFDEASAQFTDGSIDLLHLDGLHTYEAASHDFFTWLPKIKPGGVILVHDIMGRSSGFGVWRLWEELSRRFPTFAFHHSWGLGVLRIPGSTPADDPLLARLFNSDAASHEQLRRHYSLLAENLEYRYDTARRYVDLKDQICIKVYTRADAGYNEQQSVSASVPSKRWQRLAFDLPAGSPRAIRIDPADRPAIIEIAEIRIRTAVDGEVLWQATNKTDFDRIRLNQELQLLAGNDHFCCASLGFDPQMYLPDIPGEISGQPLQMEIWLAVNTELTVLAGNNVVDDLAAEGRMLRSEVRRLENEAASLILEVIALTDGHRAFSEEMLRLEQERAAAGERAQSLQDSVHVLKDTVRSLEDKVRSLESNMRALRDQVSTADLARRKLLDSWSWRITAPLRWIGEFARR